MQQEIKELKQLAGEDRCFFWDLIMLTEGPSVLRKLIRILERHGIDLNQRGWCRENILTYLLLKRPQKRGLRRMAGVHLLLLQQWMEELRNKYEDNTPCTLPADPEPVKLLAELGSLSPRRQSTKEEVMDLLQKVELQSKIKDYTCSCDTWKSHRCPI